VRVHVALIADVDIGREAYVVDLSVAGARLAHERTLRPGENCTVRFALNDDVYAFKARVVWSHVVPRRQSRDRLLFHSGLVFERIPRAAKPLLATLLAA
jgi:hypothetical protein